MDVVAGIDPALSAEAVEAAAMAVAPRRGQRNQLAWALSDRPALLTGAGAEAPVPSVLRLIDRLCDAGSSRIVRPPCPGCGRIVTLVKPHGGKRRCRICVARSRAEPCSRCGGLREAATRDRDGRPVCPNCLLIDPANHEECLDCGRRRPVHARTARGPLCGTCVPGKTLTCGVCGKQAPCVISQATGKPWCQACRQRWITCAGCGNDALLRGGSLDQPLCATCTRPDPGFWRTCPNCGQPGRLHTRRCGRCAVQQRLRDLLSNDDGEIRPELQNLHDTLAETTRHHTVAEWLDKSSAPAILRDLAGQPLTHATLDELPASKTVEHLRSILVATATLPPRDEQMARLERWITHVVADRTDPDEQQLLHRYAIWHVLRRLRGRLNGADTTHHQAMGAHRVITAAISLLDWLTAHNLTLATARQGDLDAWLATTKRSDAGNFVRWAKRQKLTQLDFPTTRWTGPTGLIDTETRWEKARWLLHDDTLNPEDRVAGLLVLLYAQWPATLSRLTLNHVDHHNNQVRLRLGPEPIELPEPLAELVLQLVATRRGHAALGDQGASPWLFPGGQPGRPISAFRLAERLRQLGIRSGQARSTALFQLSTELPAAVLARMLGIHITAAVTWQHASNGDWTNYAAEISRQMDR